jgi:hypothetical protein
MVNLRTRADEIDIIADEWGWMLQIDTDEGDRICVRLDQELALALATDKTKAIRLHNNEGYAAARAHDVELAQQSADEDFDRRVGDL